MRGDVGGSTWCFMLGATERDDLRHFNELLGSWPVQLALLALYAGVALLAFTRVARDFDDHGARRVFRAVVVALGIFVGFLVVGSAALDALVWRSPLQIIAFLWLFGMFIYYFARTVTGQRRGAGDDVSRERGAALEEVLAPLREELHGDSD